MNRPTFLQGLKNALVACVVSYTVSWWVSGVVSKQIKRRAS